MSRRYFGGMISATTPTTTFRTATGVWRLTQEIQSQQAGNWPVTPLDPSFPYNSLLLSGSTPSTNTSPFNADASTNNSLITIVGDTKPNNVNPYTPGYYSNYLNGSSSYLSSTLSALGAGDFTIEYWIYPTADVNQYIFVLGTNWGDATGVQIINYSGQLSMSVGSATSIALLANPTINMWYHHAVVRSGSSVKFYVNGVASAVTLTTSTNLTATAFKLGYGTAGSWASFIGYISNLRIVIGTAVYTANFTPPTAPLTAISGTSLLTCQSNRFIDNSNNGFTLTATGSPTVNSKNSFATPTTYPLPTSYSGYFDGTGDYLTVPYNSALNLGSDTTWTMEYWVYFNAAFGTYTPISFVQSNLLRWDMEHAASTTLLLFNNSTAVTFTNPSTLTPSNWYHIAWVRNGTTIRMYINGVASSTTSTNNLQTISSGPLSIGYNALGGYEFYMNGYISNVRLVKGVAVYTGAFTPPTSPLQATQSSGTNIAAITGTSTSLLTLQSPTFIDNSTNNFTLTVAGNTQPLTQNPFGTGVTNTAPSYLYGSTYFDGTGDYLSIPTNSGFDFQSSNFTAECWIYPIAFDAIDGTFMGVGMQSGGANWRILGAADGSLNFAGWSSGTTVGISFSSAAGAIGINRWNHVAATRSGSAWTIWANGVSVATTTNSTNLGNTGRPAYICYGFSTGAARYQNAYISNVRWVKGTAVYTTAFTPPTAPLTAIANTSLLTCQTNQPASNNVFLDNSTNAFAITRNGNTTQGTFSPFGANWSDYTAGVTSTTNKIDVSSGSAIGGTGVSYTIEGWYYFTAVSTGDYQNIFCTGNNIYPNRWIIDVYVTTTAVSLRLATESNGILFNGSQVSMGLTTWVHLAAVNNNSANTFTFYINGTAAGSRAAVSLTSTSTYQLFCNSGSFSGTLPFYVSNYRIVNATAVYTSNFTPSTTPLTAISGTKLLLNSNRFIDSSGSGTTIIVNGTHSIQRFSPFSPVTQTPITYSGYFDGTGDYLTVPSSTAFAFGSGDFTIEAWIYPTLLSDYRTIFVTDGSNSSGISLSFGAAGTPYIYYGAFYYGTAGSIILNTWQHIAAVRSSGSLVIYVNGVGSTGQTLTSTNASTNPWIGGNPSAAASQLFYGYISNMRIVNGLAVYTGTFTPPTAPLTAISGTSLLTCQSPTFVDNSANAFDITVVGDTKPTQQNPFGFTNTYTSTYTPAVYGGSAYFDGTGDYLQLVESNSLNSTTFTVETWVYFNGFYSSGAAGDHVIDLGNGTYQNIILGTNGVGTASTNQARFLMRGDGNVSVFDLTGAVGGLVLNTWYHMVGVKSGANAALFVNGVRVASIGSLSNPTTTYTNLQIGKISSAAGRYVNGYISNARLVNGSAVYGPTLTTLTIPTAPLTAISGTSLLLNMTSAGIKDSTSLTVLETVGDAKIIQTQTPYAGAYYSNLFGTGINIQAPNNAALVFGTGDFTVEMWINPTTWGASSDQLIGGAGSNALQISKYGGNSYLGVAAQGTAWIITDAALPTTGVWTHVAVTRSGTSLKVFINGIQSGSTATNSTSFTVTNGIGADITTNTYNFNGYISNVRMIKGTALYTSNFTPPTAPLTAISGTSLLTCQSNKFVDNSTNAFTITLLGTPSVSITNPFLNRNGGNTMYFDGTGDSLSAPANAVFQFTGNYTIEFWIYFTSVAGTQDLVSNYVSNAAPDWTILISSGSFQYYPSSANSFVIGQIPVANRWYHVAAVRSGTTCSMYIDGVSVGTPLTFSGTLGDATRPVYVGSRGGGSNYTFGYMSDVRITKGVARYTTTFTPPTAPFPTF